jgi:2-polyprenyl-6-methoxyphenol hydroxylase-like FAD-dependent oxidoreductase
MHDVLVVGAGPVGLTLANELARHGVRCRLIDKDAAPSTYCRAIGVTPRTLEVWRDMGLAEEMIDSGLWISGLRSIVDGHPPQDAMVPDLGLPYSTLGIPQYATERILREDLARRGGAIERGWSLTGLEQYGDGVHVTLSGSEGATELADFRYVIGCDGAHSAVRRLLGIAFEGEAYPWPFMLGDVRIDWDLPYGMSLRALRPVEGGPPEMFIAIPLPERDRYRVSMLAPAALIPAGGTDHGIQAELRGPDLGHLQAVADSLLPGKPKLSELRWSSIFRISLRLAEHYQRGRVFIAGDAAHIHPPTGGQGMNTGIQDVYNLAWKLALVLQGHAPSALLESYEAERRPVGADVLARTHAASTNYGREKGGAPDRLADTQILVSYRGGPLAQDQAGAALPGLQAGDRAPDVAGLRRYGLGFAHRLHELLRGTDHVVLVRAGSEDLDGLEALSAEIAGTHCGRVRVAVITDGAQTQRPGLTVIGDPGGAFRQAYGDAGAFAIRPDGYIGWRGASWLDVGLGSYFKSVFGYVGAKIA